MTLNTILTNKEGTPIAPATTAEQVAYDNSMNVKQAIDSRISDAEYEVMNQRINNLAKLPDSATTGDAELSDIRIGYDGTPYETAGEAVRGQVGSLSSDIDNIKNDIYALKKIENYIVEENMAYNEDCPNGTNWENAITYVFDCQSISKLYVTTKIIHSIGGIYGVAIAYDANGNKIKSFGLEKDGYTDVVTNFEINVPHEATKIKCCTYKNYKEFSASILSLKNNKKNYVKYDGETVYAKAKYSADEDIVFVLKKRGNNNLFDFQKIYLVTNDEDLNNELKENRLLVNNDTDYFSPHQVRAINNIDGDESDNYFLTGGNHDHNGVATAYCDNVKVIIDKKNVSTFKGFTDDLIIEWTNHITGHNTFKSDGSGRTILDEKIILNFKGCKIDVVVCQIPTEDIYHSIYYGLQTVNLPYPNMRYIGGENRSLINTVDETNNGSLNCREMYLYNESTKDSLIVKVDDCDLGNFDLTGESYSAFTKNRKSYWSILRNKAQRMNQNELYVLRGSYHFKSVDLI